MKILTGTIFPTGNNTAYFFIEPPYASGSFIGGSATGTIMIGYDGGKPENGMAQDIFLRPYLQ